jgi:branched-chain amino acid transport system ATP-binding protein
MEGGRVVLDGPAAELRSNPEVKEFYLGFAAHGGTNNHLALKTEIRRRYACQEDNHAADRHSGSA